MSYDPFTSSSGYYSITNVSDLQNILDDMLAWPLRAPSTYDSTNVPYGFEGEADTSGIYYNSGVCIGDDGKQQARFSDEALFVPQGSFLQPSYSFLNDGTSGMCSNGTGQVNIITSNFVSTQFGANQQRAQAGTVTLPYYSFQLDSTSGMCMIGSEILGFGTASTERLRISNSSSQFSNRILIPNGSSGTPSFSFTGDDDTGLFYSTTNTIGITAGGFQSGSFDVSGLKVNGGTASFPSISFLTDTDTGIYRGGTNIVDIACGGIQSLQISGDGAYFPLGTVLLPSVSFLGDTDTGLYRGLSNQIDIACGGTRSLNVSANGLKVLDGSQTAPTYSFINDDNSGMFSGGNNVISFTAGGVTRMSVIDSQITTTVPILALSGSATSPSYSFSADTNNGMFLYGTDSVGFSTGSTTRLFLDTNLNSLNNCRMITATTGASIPGFSFVNDTDTGVYWNGADSFGISQGGLPRWVWNSSYNFQPATDNSYDIGTTLTRVRDCYCARFLSADGAVGSPAFCFNSDSDTGLYRPENNAVGVTCAGALVFACYQTVTRSVNVFQNSNGTASIPSYSFWDNNNTGMYRSGTNTITFSTNGTGRVSINTANLITDLPIIGPAGSSSAPSYTFNSDTNTGLYSYAADQIGIACGGTLVGRFFNSGFIMNGNIFTNLTPSGGTLHWYLRTNGGVLRNAIGMSATESGSDTGSNLAFWNYTDGGGFKAQIYENERKTNNNYFWGRLWVGQTSSTTIPSIGFLNQTDCGMSSFYTDQIDFITNSVHRFSMTNNSILPAADATYNLGSSGLRMNTIYASVGSINTSDRNMKEEIVDCPLGLDFINRLRPKKYKWKKRVYEEKYYDKESKEEKVRTVQRIHTRYHMGLVAQDVKDVLDEMKVSTSDFAGYVDSTINEPDKPVVLGLNYTQFIAPMVKAMQEMSSLISELRSELDSAKIRISTLEAIVSFPT